MPEQIVAGMVKTGGGTFGIVIVFVVEVTQPDVVVVVRVTVYVCPGIPTKLGLCVVLEGRNVTAGVALQFHVVIGSPDIASD